MIGKLESFNEDVFLFTQYSSYSDYNNINIKKEEIQQFYEDVSYTKGYIKGLIECPKISFACEHIALQKNYNYIIKDLEKIFGIVVELSLIVGEYVDFLKNLC